MRCGLPKALVAATTTTPSYNGFISSLAACGGVRSVDVCSEMDRHAGDICIVQPRGCRSRTATQLKIADRLPRGASSRPTIEIRRLAMDRIKTSEDIDQHRRRFFGTAAMAVAVAQFGIAGSAAAQPSKHKRPDMPRIKQGTNNVLVAEADRCRPAQCRLCRSRSRRRSCGHSPARLALRHSQLCRRRAAPGLGRLPGDRTVYCAAMARHDLFPTKRSATPSRQRSRSMPSGSWMRSRSRRRHRRL